MPLLLFPFKNIYIYFTFILPATFTLRSRIFLKVRVRCKVSHKGTNSNLKQTTEKCSHQRNKKLAKNNRHNQSNISVCCVLMQHVKVLFTRLYILVTTSWERSLLICWLSHHYFCFDIKISAVLYIFDMSAMADGRLMNYQCFKQSFCTEQKTVSAPQSMGWNCKACCIACVVQWAAVRNISPHHWLHCAIWVQWLNIQPVEFPM